MMIKRTSVQWALFKLGLSVPQLSTTEAERSVLRNYAKGKYRLVEIGVFQGVTGALLSSVMDKNGSYYAVDPYYGGRLGVDFNFLIARNIVSKSCVGEVVWIRKTGKDAALDIRVIGNYFDFIFIDGDHSYEGLKGDWMSWKGLVEKNGIVALHDTCGRNFGSQDFFEKIIMKDTDFVLLEQVDSLSILSKRG